jgi:hypothetical protein
MLKIKIKAIIVIRLMRLNKSFQALLHMYGYDYTHGYEDCQGRRLRLRLRRRQGEHNATGGGGLMALKFIGGVQLQLMLHPGPGGRVKPDIFSVF